MKNSCAIDKHLALREFEPALVRFEEALGVNITLHDYTGLLHRLDGKRLFPNRNYHQCPYCVAGRFQEPGWRNLCVRDCMKDSDPRLLKTPEPYLKHCWKGVIELVIPLVSRNRVMAGIYVGAFKGEIPETSTIPKKHLEMHARLPELPGPEERLRLLTMITLFFQGMLSVVRDIQESGQNMEYDRKTVISRFIQKQASGRVRLTDLARHLCLSPSRTVHVVSSLFKRSFSELVLQERMNQARTLLENDWLTLEEIAGRTGFRNVYYFNSVFRKHFGTPPGRYRKNPAGRTSPSETPS